MWIWVGDAMRRPERDFENFDNYVIILIIQMKKENKGKYNEDLDKSHNKVTCKINIRFRSQIKILNGIIKRSRT